MNKLVLECSDLHKSYREASRPTPVLAGVNLTVGVGERIAIMGASGSGKSTLLNLLGGLDRPDQGQVRIVDTDLYGIDEKARNELRNRKLGFVYQFHHLLAEFDALENVAMPLLIRRDPWRDARARAHEILVRVGLEQRLDHKPAQLSGGERQRVAIARALVTRPDCVLLDEPTGNLDRHAAENIHALMLELSAEFSVSFVVVTHDMRLARRMELIYELVDGKLSPLDAEDGC